MYSAVFSLAASACVGTTPYSTVVGVPGHVVKRKDTRVPTADMDHIHMPDVVMNDIEELTKRIEMLEKQLAEKEKGETKA